MPTYAAAPLTTANNTNQKAAQSRSGILNTLPWPVVVSQKTTANNTNQKAAQSTNGIALGCSRTLIASPKTTANNTNQLAAQPKIGAGAVFVVPLAATVNAAPKPTAVNTGGGQAGYAG